MGILDRSFPYVNAARTDIRKTFARERKRLAEAQKQKESNVAQIKPKIKVRT